MADSSIPLAKTDPPPNFFSDYSVVLSVPLKRRHERVCRLSKLCAEFKLLEKDAVDLPVPAHPDGKTLKDVAVRTSVATAGVDGSRNQDEQGGGIQITRQHFTMEETVPLLFGLLKSKVLLTGTLSWDDSVLSSSSSEPSSETESSDNQDDSPLYALYESIASGSGLVVWKLRTFTKEVGDPEKTRVTERVEGWAPKLLRAIVQNETTKGHRAHMDSYHTLF
ncbi:hypothetical protein CPB84DRAFT_1930087 [Gymnopilus junonius]|uniref:Uncharacterized protein n=1 Tax=Gymnopilus junonius TaxID=109634 RepID=A0A9P5NY68_GYMJU|nr:hypothetical protein CPB84DRAFT_1930087 [Gymnopilus junonius]